MANEEQLAILRQGVDVWNEWREENPKIKIDLSEAKLGRLDLATANLSRCNLNQADLRKANLSEANLSDASLISANLRDANLTSTELRNADLAGANLRKAQAQAANFKLADLRDANLTRAYLKQSNLSETILVRANFFEARLVETNFSHATLFSTIFGGSDLSKAVGLEYIRYLGPSSISIDTFALSKGEIPEAFLRGCGLSDWEIEMAKLYDPDLSNEKRNQILYKIFDLQASQTIKISPLFISYSHANAEFVNRLENQLNAKGIRFWRDIHNMKAGRIETQIDRAIGQNRTVLLILSEHSIKSDWVEHEVRTARGLEKDMGRDVLCPIALDDSWKSSLWPKRVMEQIMEYNILDFSAWKDDSKFEGMFRKLIDGLELFYKDKSHG